MDTYSLYLNHSSFILATTTLSEHVNVKDHLPYLKSYTNDEVNDDVCLYSVDLFVNYIEI